MVKRLLPWALLALLGGCAGPRTYVVYDPRADFAGLKTYAIQKNEQLLLTARERLLGINLRGMIESAIDRDLAAKGYQRAGSSGEADFTVRYAVEVEQTAPDPGGGSGVRPELAQLAAAGYNPYVPPDRPAEDNALDDRRTGWLVIEMINPRTGTDMWRGVQQSPAQTLPDRADDVARNRRLAQGVNGLLSRFPPR